MTTTITFKFDGSDPEDGTGMTASEYERIFSAVSNIGGYDIDAERDDPALDRDDVERLRKPKMTP